MPWILEPRDDDNGHVLINRTGAPAHSVEVRSLDHDADAWHAARPPYGPERHGTISLDSLDGEVSVGADIGGWRFTPGPGAVGVIEIRWSDAPGGPRALAERIDIGISSESFPT